MIADVPAITPLGDRALVVRLGDEIGDEVFERVRAAHGRLVGAHAAITDVVPGYTSVTVHYDPAALGNGTDTPPHRALADVLANALRTLDHAPALEARTVEIPVCYDGALAPDMDRVASHAGIDASEVISLHAAATYTVRMIGFTPGFPYLAGLDPRLATPRRAEPRTRVVAGSVGIGGAQTGIYPLATPGGWNLIGSTPLSLFDPARKPAAMLRIGDLVRFAPIRRARYDAMVRR